MDNIQDQVLIAFGEQEDGLQVVQPNEEQEDGEEVVLEEEEEEEEEEDGVAFGEQNEVPIGLGEEEEDEVQVVLEEQGDDLEIVAHIQGQSACDDTTNTSLVGLTRQTSEEFYELYCSHACECGFSVRKSTIKYNKNRVIRERYFVCSCEGQKHDNGKETKGRKKQCVTRTGCKAMLRVRLNRGGFYEVMDHELKHNHELTRPEWSHLHQSERKITNEKADAVEDMLASEWQDSVNGRLDRSKDFVPWRHDMARKYYNLILKCQDDEEARKFVEEGYARASLAVTALITSSASIEQSDTSSTIRDPARAQTKGRSKRIERHFPNKKKAKKKTDTSTSIQGNEFGSKTPDLHLF